jgi:hypothetical protein
MYSGKEKYKCGKGHRGHIANFQIFYIETVIINIYSNCLESN